MRSDVHTDSLRLAISQFEIGEPIKSLFNPRFEVSLSHYTNQIIIRLVFDRVPDALGKFPNGITVQMDSELPASVIEFPQRLPRHLRDMLHNLLKHEADESIIWQGRRIYDPHKNEPDIY